MRIVAGLGNPGKGYRDTRHNVGFMVVDRLAEMGGIKVKSFKYRGRVGSGLVEGEKVYFIKPRTYMNLSGEAVSACLKGLGRGPEDLIVIHDDVDLAMGRVKVKFGGGAGGHKGIQSVIDRLGTRDFSRVRIGVGKPDPNEDTADYVLSPFSKGERDAMESALEKGARATLCLMLEGVERAMNKFNSM